MRQRITAGEIRRLMATNTRRVAPNIGWSETFARSQREKERPMPKPRKRVMIIAGTREQRMDLLFLKRYNYHKG